MSADPTAPGTGVASDRPTRSVAALCSAALSILFLVVYGACNEVTARRTAVGVLFWEWERAIPFVPAMIVPYMSIDLFFVAAPFLCATRWELRKYAARILLAILGAGAVFLSVPLRLAFDHPGVGGWYGFLFGLLEGFDRPYNLFPSLHITLGFILVDHYSRHTRGALRGAIRIWFVWVAASTLLTWRHHVPDVLAGGGLAAVCFYAAPVARPVAADYSFGAAPMNIRVGSMYAAAAVALGAAAVGFGGAWLLLLWPAAALAIVSAAYFGRGAVVFRKTEGHVPLSVKLVLAPVLVGIRLSHAWLRRGGPSGAEIVPNLRIGRLLNEREAAEATSTGVTAVLDLTAEYGEVDPFRRCAYRCVPILDLTAPTTRQLGDAADFIESRIRGGIVYVHCALGVSRSALAAAAYLLASGRACSVEAAVKAVREARPEAVLKPEAVAALTRFREENDNRRRDRPD